MKDTFSNLHPLINFTYFVLVIGFSMFIMNPVCLAISFTCAFLNAVYLNGMRTVKFSLLYLLPMIILITIINPVFNHEGVTILTYLPWGNPLTLESIIYGIVTAVLLSSTVLWFSCFNTIITSDKLIYLFGRIIPSLSLMMSMALRFVPKFTEQMKCVKTVQRSVGRDFSTGTLLMRIKYGIKIISVMITMSLENAIETADSMKSRGYGLKGRTAYSIYRFSKRDAIFLCIIALLGILDVILIFTDSIKFRYFPSVKGNLFSVNSILFFALYALLMMLPIIINTGEGLNWKHTQSKI